MNILFSILLPAYKTRFLRVCIDSILAQTYTNWELIIVNDASPEDVSSIVTSYQDSRIHYSVNEHNIGAVDLVKQWNTCLAQAKGEYCICIGDDDMLTPDCLATYASYIDKYPFAGILHGQTDIIDENGELICHTPPRPSWESAMSLLYNRTYIYRQQFIGDFCYNCAELKARGGFYTLPLAWGSDDISAIEAAKTGGIANTSEVIFLYRSNRMSITKQTFVRQKIKACILEARWKWNFLRHAQSELQDEKYRNILRKGLLIRTAKNIYYIMRNAWRK